MEIKTVTVGAIQTNCYILRDENTNECAAIDPGADIKKILSAIEGLKVKYILLTHGHFDHFGAAEELRQITGAKVLINEKDAQMMEAGGEGGSFFFQRIQPPCEYGFFNDGDELTLGTLKLRIMNTPGHSQGSCIIICGDVIFSGDTLFCESWGRCDLEGGSEEDIRRSLIRISELPGDYTVLPGHEERTTLEHERRYNPMMQIV